MVNNSSRQMSHVEQILNKCVHFTGIQTGTCRQGVPYDSVRDTTTHPYRWPCLKVPSANTTCQLFRAHTQEEAQKEVEEWDSHIKNFLQKIKDGKCPVCNIVVEKRQVGPCVYGTCGHRLYQGRI